MTPDTIITKLCRKCGEEKPLTEFHIDNTKTLGRSSYCKECKKKWHKTHKKIPPLQYISITTKKCSVCNEIKPVSEFNRDGNKLDGYGSLCKPCNIIYQKTYRDKNHDILVKKTHETYRRNRAVLLQKKREYNKTPRGKVTKSRNHHIRRQRIKSNVCSLTAEQWNKVLQNQNNRCNICGKVFCKSRPATMDHIIPVSKGGGLTFENVQALCRSCNCSKSANYDMKLIVSWGVYS